MLTLLPVLALCWILVRRVLNEDSPLLVVGLTFSLSNLLLLSMANLDLAAPGTAWGMLFVLAGLSRNRPPKAFDWPAFSKRTWAVLGFALLAILAYCALMQNLCLDDDFWIHFPLQGLLETNGLPVLHPFFSEITMNGHYGRDLLIATVARQTGLSIVVAQFWQTLLSQLFAFLTLAGLVNRATRCPLSVVLTCLFVFYGINVGGRGGLSDCYTNNNAMAYLLTLSLFHLISLVYLAPSPARITVASLALGTFALVYETHFGLIGLLLLLALLATRRKEFAAVGLAAVLVAGLQGGPITGLVKQRIWPTQRVWTPGELNQHQIVKLSFPKSPLFQIQLAHGDYQRRSLVYGLLPDLGSLSSVSPGTPYRPFWSWDVLMIHWLPTLLAPWSLLILARPPRKDPLGLGFWFFGLFAFLTPALVNFGPIYEFEYFRWQFAAGFGFAAAFGIAAGSYLSSKRATARAFAVGLLVLGNILPSVAVFYPRVFYLAYQHGHVRDAFVSRSEAHWVLANQKRLTGFSELDLLAAYELKKRRQPRQRLLVNAPWAGLLDLDFESTLTALSGVRSVGHSLPWPQEAVGTPPYHRSAPNRVFWSCPSLDLLDQLEVDWVFLRPGRESTDKLKLWLSENCQEVWAQDDYQLFSRKARSASSCLLGTSTLPSSSPPPALLVPPPATTWTGQKFSFRLAESEGHKLWAWTTVKKKDAPVDQAIDLHEVVTWRAGRCAAVAPPESGLYDLVFFEVVNRELRATPQRVPLRVLERKQPSTLGTLEL